jgi:hypothetical protein
LVPEDRAAIDRLKLGEFTAIAHATMIHGLRAFHHAERATDRVQRVLKGAIAPMDSADAGAAISDLQTLGEAFAASLIGTSVFDTLLNGGMVRTPLRARGVVISTAPSASLVHQGSAKPISEMSLTGATLEPQKVWAAVAATRELLDLSRPGARALFESELRKAIVRAVDSVLLAQLFAAVTPIQSAGPTFANMMTDLDALLAEVDLSPTSRVYWVVGTNVVKTWVTMQTTNGGFAFPNLTLSGGAICGGIVVIPSDNLPEGGSPGVPSSLLIVADGLRGNLDRFAFRQISQGDIILDAAPDSPSIATTLLQNMWQHNLAALAVERYFAVEAARPRAVAAVSY